MPSEELAQRIVAQGVAQRSKTAMEAPFMPPGVRLGFRFRPPANYHAGVFFAITFAGFLVPDVLSVWSRGLNQEHGPFRVTQHYINEGGWDIWCYYTSEIPLEVWFRNDAPVGLPFYSIVHHLNIRTVEEMGAIIQVAAQATTREVIKQAVKLDIPSYLPKVPKLW